MFLSDFTLFAGEDIEEGVKFTDSSVCKSFLMGLCPFDLFHNTVGILFYSAFIFCSSATIY